jgi:hypothetical protein
MDAANIALTPDESLVAVADTCLAYKVLVYGLDGALVGSYSAYGDALGVRCVSWSPDSQLLAVGSYDQVRAPGSSRWAELAVNYCSGSASCRRGPCKCLLCQQRPLAASPGPPGTCSTIM